MWRTPMGGGLVKAPMEYSDLVTVAAQRCYDVWSYEIGTTDEPRPAYQTSAYKPNLTVDPRRTIAKCAGGGADGAVGDQSEQLDAISCHPSLRPIRPSRCHSVWESPPLPTCLPAHASACAGDH